MKKLIVTLAVLTVFSSAASAQSSVVTYGIADAGIAMERGGAAGSSVSLVSGMASASRLGFKGREELGGGLAANFLLEAGYAIDTGASTQGGVLFGRQAFVGLSGAFGAVSMGRQYTPQYNALVMADPFASGLAGNSGNIMPHTGDAGSRMTNSIKYVTPTLQGFTGELAYAFGEVAGDSGALRQIGAALAYANGPLNVQIAYHDRNNNNATVTNTDNAKNSLLALTYDFGMAKAYFAYGKDTGLTSSSVRNTTNPFGSAIEPTASIDSTDLLVGVAVPLGRGTFLASYVGKNDKTTFNQDANQLGIGYMYALSKRTNLYTAYARINNKNGAGYTVGSAIAPGSGDKAFQFGIRHVF